MEKLGDDSAAKFINALIKSVQTLCHGYLDFQNGVEIIGHINLSVDKGSSLDYILKEKVCKNAENSTLFISNSFHAEPKPEPEVPGKPSQSGNQVSQNIETSDSTESGKVSSAISSISSALTGSRERSRRSSGAKDSNSSHSQPNTAKRKASEDESSEVRPAKVSYHDQLSHVTSESSYPPGSSSPVDSKEALQALRAANDDMSETVLPQTANVRTDVSDIGVNLAGSVLEPVEEGQNNPDLGERDDDSDNDLEVTFIKEEYVEGDGSACDFENSGGQQFGRGQQQRASDGMADPSLYALGLHPSSASATYVPSAAGQQYSASGSASSTSQPQPGPSGMRGTALGYHPGATEKVAASASFITPPYIMAPHPMTSSLNASGHKEGGPPRALYVCEFCDASFTFDSSLNRHRNSVHLNKNLHVCGICGKGITRKENFEDHMNMHKNIKAHKCPHCGIGFTFKNKLRLHIRTQH